MVVCNNVDPNLIADQRNFRAKYRVFQKNVYKSTCVFHNFEMV